MELECSAFLFDLDGVLVDSREVVRRVCIRWARRHGLDPENVIRVAHGRRSQDTVKALTPHLDHVAEAAWIDAIELADVDGLRAVPGAREFLAKLDRRSWAVVTSCGSDLATLRLSSVGLPLPELMVTSADVSMGKPAPDGYQLGAKHLGHEAARCIVFEDAPAGISAGKAAGATVIALRTTHPDADFAGAKAVIPDFTRLSVRRDHAGYVLSVLD